MSGARSAAATGGMPLGGALRAYFPARPANMPPDPHTSGYVGIVPAIGLWLLMAWVSRAHNTKTSKTEERALSLLTGATIFLVLLPLHLMVGLFIVGLPVLASPVVETLTGFDVKAFVRANLWTHGHVLSSIVWTALVGAIPPLVAMLIGTRRHRRNDP